MTANHDDIECKPTDYGYIATHKTVPHIHAIGLTESSARVKASEQVKQYKAQLCASVLGGCDGI